MGSINMESSYLLRLLRESEARQAIRNRLGNIANSIEQILDRFSDDSKKIANNPDLSDEGKSNRLKALALVHDIDLRTIEAGNKFPSEIEAIREKLAPEQISNPIDKLTQQSRDREIRDHFRKFSDDSVKFRTEFQTAINGQYGRDILGGIERSPINIVPRDLVQEVAEAREIVEKIENPGLVAELDELLESNGSFVAAIRSAKNEVGYQPDSIAELAAGNLIAGE